MVDLGKYQLYKYVPNLAAAVIFTIIFLVFLIIFIISLVRNLKGQNYMQSNDLDVFEFDPKAAMEKERQLPPPKKPKLYIFVAFIPILVAIALEAAGYALRIEGHFHRQALGPYIASTVFLLVAPGMIAASIYMIFGRLLVLLDCPDMTIIPIRFLTAFFVTGDVVSFLLQASGGGLMAEKSTETLGTHIIIAGLIVQLCFFAFFIFTQIRFTIMIRKYPTQFSRFMSESRTYGGKMGRYLNWRYLNIGLMVAGIFILIRSIVRLVEFIEGFDGYIISHEAFLYCLDGLVMFFCCLTIYLNQSEKVLLELQYQKFH